ncbi:hypothetical protein [Autumnicola psychrophila]|uniref:Uncharacterized protein n=1 Tax=Autumnicola psychrophila TaxID=3075592 RepID=A0ABU3DUP6_9FLAO|nr:hypothetical protein [Zunongwangia sp. F225]MDT0687442.1 hypothetical protein [Zunongwangia sp. F225]
MEYILNEMNFAEAVKNEFIQQNSPQIKLLFLGSSQIERAVNPKYLSITAVNLANASQTLYEDFQLLKFFQPKLPNLKMVVIEISYDKLERDKSHVLPIIDPKNLKFYGVNTFDRQIKIQDNFLFHFSPQYFSKKLEEEIFSTSSIELNKYGFDENKYDGAYSRNADYILIENIKNNENYKKNILLLDKILTYSYKNKLKIMVYHPPTHKSYNNLRDPKLMEKWKNLMDSLKSKHPDIPFFIEDTNEDFTRKFFDDGNHLNPIGAEKATKRLDSVIHVKYPQLFKEINGIHE